MHIYTSQTSLTRRGPRQRTEQLPAELALHRAWSPIITQSVSVCLVCIRPSFRLFAWNLAVQGSSMGGLAGHVPDICLIQTRRQSAIITFFITFVITVVESLFCVMLAGERLRWEKRSRAVDQPSDRPNPRRPRAKSLSIWLLFFFSLPPLLPTHRKGHLQACKTRKGASTQWVSPRDPRPSIPAAVGWEFSCPVARFPSSSHLSLAIGSIAAFVHGLCADMTMRNQMNSMPQRVR
ncbi:hypothetical protein F4802DRAFT_391514 [Xylaria palmicola]|nr:hypothetical protein F4802DRAFT_391514 [Xylaria palmicola]